MGDTPYSEGEVKRLDHLIHDLNAEPPAFVAHIGDITSGCGRCPGEWFRVPRAELGPIKPPFVLRPGDNDWTDCRRSGMEPVERLAYWRKLFCARGGQL